MFIPEIHLISLIEFSNRDENDNLVLDDCAPEYVVELAKKYNWRPYNKDDIM